MWSMLLGNVFKNARTLYFMYETWSGPHSFLSWTALNQGEMSVFNIGNRPKLLIHYFHVLIFFMFYK